MGVWLEWKMVSVAPVIELRPYVGRIPTKPRHPLVVFLFHGTIRNAIWQMIASEVVVLFWVLILEYTNASKEFQPLLQTTALTVLSTALVFVITLEFTTTYGIYRQVRGDGSLALPCVGFGWPFI